LGIFLSDMGNTAMEGSGKVLKVRNIISFLGGE
jgi:hypothetical protein